MVSNKNLGAIIGGSIAPFLFLFHSSLAQGGNKIIESRRNIPFDSDWLFSKDKVANAQQIAFNDTQWRKLDIPHDWSIEDLPNQKKDTIIGPFDRKSMGSIFTGFTKGGTAWYRKKFKTDKVFQNKQVSIYFDGIYMNSDVWLNGHYLGNHPNGYTPFYYDLTPYLNPLGQENVLAVQVRNEGMNSRWYSGSGIYRHASLIVTDPTHIATWGVYVTTPLIDKQKATVKIHTTIINERQNPQSLSLVSKIVAPNGKIVGQATQKINTKSPTDQQIIVSNPNLWTLEAPTLYTLISEIKESNKTIDRVETPFGIRSIHVDAQNGFTLNGKRVLLKGGCVHHDNGPLGAAAIDRAEERKIEILKKNGFNAIRLSHNPPSKQFLDICDRLGMLVIDEAFDAWEKAKLPHDSHTFFKDWWQKDLDAMLLRDRNHPSIIMWSIGNEIPERVDSLQTAKKLVDRVHLIDPTRPVTEALCKFWDKPTYKWDTTANAFALLDVGGYNYEWQRYEADHEKYPNRIMVGSESLPKDALENWNLVEKHPYIIGDFVWTAFDYLGEASTGNATYDKMEKKVRLLKYPWFNAWCGDIDLVGNKKPQSYYRDVVWRNSPIEMAVHEPIAEGMVENISDWGWPLEKQSWSWHGAEGKPLQVRVFSRASFVRLYLNNQLIDEQKIAPNSITARFQVPYQTGTLKAVNVENGIETQSVVLKTVGTANKIRLTADRTKIKASRNDLSFVAVEIVDENNQVVPTANVPIQFSISGEGELAGVGSASPTEMASFQQPKRNTTNGKCLAILRPTGKKGNIILKAYSNGLTAAQIVISTQ
ncbi:glycoside hydrolase family 2 TIM barrel-domain containing protein [Arcicella lustrica]|uniref:Glycoside hydrolase family 2 TIM barrel-domain containing protein n=1 Tax=Arcicella lustrica TaxID=2984196 RepID=A0ABU5SKP3_9BACT|nr:glycoside hydrolase family 2 TIM barrel-domain containing protein [Arcicella sp. DC25W]MEA5427873.1 glycoside hydrolase family 2 TIM barrel-domain containing protein [Arcicella sp. DC25W]